MIDKVSMYCGCMYYLKLFQWISGRVPIMDTLNPYITDTTKLNTLDVC